MFSKTLTNDAALTNTELAGVLFPEGLHNGACLQPDGSTDVLHESRSGHGTVQEEIVECGANEPVFHHK